MAAAALRSLFLVWAIFGLILHENMGRQANIMEGKRKIANKNHSQR